MVASDPESLRALRLVCHTPVLRFEACAQRRLTWYNIDTVRTRDQLRHFALVGNGDAKGRQLAHDRRCIGRMRTREPVDVERHEAAELVAADRLDDPFEHSA